MSANISDRWMVGLDLTEMDKTVVSWVNQLSKVLKPKQIYFMHVERNLEMPDYIPKELQNTMLIADESQQAAMIEVIEKNFDNKDVEIDVDVVEGEALSSFLHWVQVKKVGLFIVGRKYKENGSGTLPRKLSRKLSCQLLFIPPIEVRDIKNIMVPIDFSEHSTMALDNAVAFAKEKDDVEIRCLHAYEIPIGYYKTGKTLEEFDKIMQHNSTAKCKHYLEPYDIKMDYKCVRIDKGLIADQIAHEVDMFDLDLVVMGSKGQSTGALILLGSVAEEVIRLNEKCLTWVVKNPAENIGFFEAVGKL